MRIAAGIVAAVAGVLTVLLGGGLATAEPALGIEVAPVKAQYAPGEPVELSVRVVNRTGAPCQLAEAPTGAMHLMALTRDDTAVLPSFVRGSYLNGFGSAVRQALRTVKPNESVSFRLAAAPRSLQTDSPLPGGGSLNALRPVDATGEYQVSLQYRVPTLDGVADLCAASSNVATATFTVGDSASGRTMWLLIAASAGVLILLVVVWLLLRRRKRAGATALLVLAVTVGTAVAAVPRANASVKLDPEGHALKSWETAYAGCMAKIGEFDPALRRDIESKKTGKVTIRPVNQTDDKGSRSVNHPDKTSEIWWNDTDTSVLDPRDAVALDPCASLYHELFHAYRNHDGKLSDATCGRTGILTDEVEATLKENEYRSKKVTVPDGENKFRQFYDGKLMPDSMAACGQPPPKPKRGEKERRCGGAGEPPAGLRSGLRATVRAQDCEESPASSNGDPHLTTFDQRHYTFQAVGEFVAARSGDGFAVHARQSPIPHSDDRAASVNSAVAMRVGADRVGFYVENGDVVVRVNGNVETLRPGDRKLSGGGTLTRGPSYQEHAPDGYTVFWPDGSVADVDGIGPWGLRLMLYPSATYNGKLAGLLGNHDGNGDNDLRTRNGKPVEPDFDQIHKVFGDSWRLAEDESLFDYQPGESTATFTDRAFPERERTADELPAAVRKMAELACRLVGVTDPAIFAQCVLDVAVTGQPAFAVNAANLQHLQPDDNPKPPPVDDAGTIKDGQEVSGTFDKAGEVDGYEVELAAGEEITLVDQDGDLFSELHGPDAAAITGGTLPGPHQHGVTKAGRYQLRVYTTDGVTGPYGFRLMKHKPRRIPLTVDGTISDRRLDERGRLDMYTFDAGDASAVSVVTDGCDSDDGSDHLEFDIAEDVPGFELSTPHPWCYDFPIAVEPGKRYVLVVWSTNATVEDYPLGLRRG